MPFVPAPNIGMCELRCVNALQRVENRIMVNFLGAVTSVKLGELAEECWNWWELTAAPQMSSAVRLVETVATDMSTLNGPQVTYAPDTTTTGTDNSGALPNEVSFCVSLRTANRGRSARGRFYWIAVTVDQMQDQNQLKVAKAAAIVDAVNDLRQAIENKGWQMSIVSYVSNKVPRPGGPVYFPITNCISTDLLVDSMKRRKPGVGT